MRAISIQKIQQIGTLAVCFSERIYTNYGLFPPTVILRHVRCSMILDSVRAAVSAFIHSLAGLSDWCS